MSFLVGLTCMHDNRKKHKNYPVHFSCSKSKWLPMVQTSCDKIQQLFTSELESNYNKCWFKGVRCLWKIGLIMSEQCINRTMMQVKLLCLQKQEKKILFGTKNLLSSDLKNILQ